MKLSKFVSGRYIERYRYKSFEPSKINISWELDNSDVIMLLSKADNKLGELNAYSQLIPDVDFFIRMHVVKESASSSRIEGTRANIEEALQVEENIRPERRDDWLEVQNYIQAMNFSVEQLKTQPLSNRLIRNAHKTLLQGVRGEHKLPGEFRKSQNWIGGGSIADAIFVPPHFQELPDLTSDFEKFLHNEHTGLPQLVKIGVAHYQFETIHPFLDGNGRIGRLLITLFLIDKKLLAKPTLYLSDYFEKNRLLYYDNLQNARINNNLAQWLKFFLQGVITTAEKSVQTFRDIITLKEKVENRIASLGKRRTNAKLLLTHLYANPIVDIKKSAELLKVDFSTAKRLIDAFVRREILTEITGYKRNRLFVLDEYLKLFS